MIKALAYFDEMMVGLDYETGTEIAFDCLDGKKQRAIIAAARKVLEAQPSPEAVKAACDVVFDQRGFATRRKVEAGVRAAYAKDFG